MKPVPPDIDCSKVWVQLTDLQRHRIVLQLARSLTKVVLETENDRDQQSFPSDVKSAI